MNSPQTTETSILYPCSYIVPYSATKFGILMLTKQPPRLGFRWMSTEFTDPQCIKSSHFINCQFTKQYLSTSLHILLVEEDLKSNDVYFLAHSLKISTTYHPHNLVWLACHKYSIMFSIAHKTMLRSRNRKLHKPQPIHLIMLESNRFPTQSWLTNWLVQISLENER